MKNKIRRIFFTLTSSVFMSIPVHSIRHLYLKMFIKDMGNNVYIGKHLDIKSPENIIIPTATLNIMMVIKIIIPIIGDAIIQLPNTLLV